MTQPLRYLWPEDDPDERRAHLTTALSHTRTALAGIYGDKLEFFRKDRSVGVAYVNPEYFDSDVWQFDELIKRRDRVDAATRIEELTTATELYRGELGYAIERANKLTEPYEIWLRPFRGSTGHASSTHTRASPSWCVPPTRESP